jgi:hypothetical protein
VTPPASGVRIQLPRTTTLTGRIRGLSPAEVAKWRVRTYDETGELARNVKIAPDGTFHVDGVKVSKQAYVGAYYWQDDRYALRGPIDLTAGKEVVLTLEQGTRISGVVDDLKSPEKVQAAVWAQRDDGWRSSGRVQADGTFEIRGLPPGRYTVKGRTYGTPGASRQAEAKGVQAGATGVRLRIP